MSSQGNVNGHLFQKTSMETPYCYVLLRFLIIRWLCMQEIRKMKSQLQLHSYIRKRINTPVHSHTSFGNMANATEMKWSTVALYGCVQLWFVNRFNIKKIYKFCSSNKPITCPYKLVTILHWRNACVGTNVVTIYQKSYCCSRRNSTFSTWSASIQYRIASLTSRSL